MRREWELEDLIECWTLDEEEFALLANKSGATRLGFGLMLKFFELEARFPRREDVPRPGVEFMAGQVKVDAQLFAAYDWSGRTVKNHRAQIREFHGFREPTVGDEDKLADWLATKICPVEMSRDRLRGALLARCREGRIEPPKTTRIERVLGAAEAMFERNFTATTVERLSFESVGKLEELIVAEAAPAGVSGLVERIPYELCVLVALRKAIRRREIWVEGANTWRNPDEDLPADFEDNRDVHYEALAKPRDPADFIADLQKRHVAALGRLNKGLKKATTGGGSIARRKGEPWISVPPLGKQIEPENLEALKEEIARRWGVIDLLDLIKNVDHATKFTGEFTSVASRTVTDAKVLRRRLLLCTFGLGTNMGIKRVADGTAAIEGMEADTEAALRRTRRLFVNRDNLRAAIRTVVNMTLEVRDVSLWGPGTACARRTRARSVPGRRTS